MDSLSPFVDPQSLLEFAWSHIVQACSQRRHPFHTATLCTVSDRGPEARSVILRDADVETWELRANADSRSPKVRQVSADSRSTWHFYSFPDHLQVRCYGQTYVHHGDEIAREAWQKSQLLSRRCYLAPIAPSTPLALPDPNIPSELLDREPTEEESEVGFENFSVLRCEVSELDILSLRYEGNQRILLAKGGVPNWLAP